MGARPFRPRNVLGGKWEDRGSTLTPPFRCRWFFSWTEYDAGRLAGFFAGYEGGGAFVEERFAAQFEGGALQHFIWNGCDHGDGHPVGAPPRTGELDQLAQRHFDVFISWHDRARWESGYLCLAPAKVPGLVLPPDALYLPPKPERSSLARIAALLSCTGIATRISVSDQAR